MCLISNIQFSVFSENSIEANMETIVELLGELNEFQDYEFLPNIMPIPKFNRTTGKLITDNRVLFTTTDYTRQIACLGNRIDVMININNNIELKNHLDYEQKILSMIMEKEKIQSNRLAINVDFISDVFNGNLRDTKMGKNLCKTFKFYDNLSLNEWAIRMNSRKEITINEPEILNVVSEISIMNEDNSQNYRFLCHVDINTVQETSKYRFDFSNIKKFENESLCIITDLKENFEELIDNE